MNSPEQASRYETARARIAAMYQIPTPRRLNPRILDLHVAPQRCVIDANWPATRILSCRLAGHPSPDGELDPSAEGIVECTAGIDAILPFPSAAFDLVILHYTLDELAAMRPKERPAAVAEQLLRRVVGVLDKGGLVAGCTRNASILQGLGGRQRLSASANDVGQSIFTPAACERALDRAGLGDIAVFSVLPVSDDPRVLVSTKARASRRAFRHQLERNRDALSPADYLVRRVITELALNRLIEQDLFFFGYRIC